VAHEKGSETVRHAEQHGVKEPNPFAAGYAAGKAGKDAHKANPYKSHQREWKRWVNGYQTAQLEAINNRPLPDWVTAQEATK
jgi:ribosome modulation factor